MKQNWFEVNNVRYYTGSVVVLRQVDSIAVSIIDMDAVFVYYNTETNTYAFEINGRIDLYPNQYFNKIFVTVSSARLTPNIEPTDSVNKKYKKKISIKDELNVEGLLVGWVWYIIIMAVAVIFYDRTLIWILASIIFIVYRNKRLREAGYK